MADITNQVVLDYYLYLCDAWGRTPTQDIDTGYESALQQLKKLDKHIWENSDDIGKKQIEDNVFEIYRNIGVIPIDYYSLNGCASEVRSLLSVGKDIKNKILLPGSNQGLSFCRFWFENMQDAHTRTDKEVSLRGRFENDVKLRRAINFCYKHRDVGERSVYPSHVRRALELVSGGSIQNFKPMNARAVWEYICPVFGGRVLDFSAGYGGRMLGAMTSNIRYSYTGIDPNTKTFNALNALGHLINGVTGTEFSMHHTTSEDFVPEKSYYDAAFSSPPYFNLETYSDEPTQCMNRYTNLDNWFEFYVEPTLKMIHTALVPGAIYAVNIADYNIGNNFFAISERWKAISEKLGFEFVETVDMRLKVRPGVGHDHHETTFKSEPIYLFKRK